MKHTIVFFFLLFIGRLFSQQNLYPVIENGTFKLIDYNGTTVKGPYPVDELRVYDGYNGDEGVSTIAPLDQFVKYGKNGKTGVIDLKGNEIFPAKYDTIREVWGSKKIIAEAKQNKKWGLLNQNLTWLVEPLYDEIYAIGYIDSLVYINVMKDSLWGALDANAKQIVPCQYDEMVEDSYIKDLWIVTKNEKKGLHISNRELIVPCEYDKITDFMKGFSIGAKGANYYLLNRAGKAKRLPPSIIAPGLFPNGMVELLVDRNNYTLIDSTGKVIISACQELSENSMGILIRKNKKMGFVDFNGKIIAPPLYKELDYSSGSNGNIFCVVKQNNLYGLYNRTGKLVIPILYEKIENTSLGPKIKKLGKWGIVDYNGVPIAPAVYSDFGYTDSTCYVYSKNKKWGLLGYKNKKAIPPIYDNIRFSGSDDLFIVTSKGKEGLVNAYGEIVWPIEYDDIRLYEDYSYRLATMYTVGERDEGVKFGSGLPANVFYVRKQGRYGILNLKGEVIIPAEYDNIEAFSVGLAQAQKNDHSIIINRSGKEVLPIDAKANDELFICDSLVKVKRNKKWGLIDQSGKWLIKPMYDSLLDFDQRGRTICMLDGKNGIVSSSGKVIVKPVSPYLIGYHHDLGIIANDHKIVSYIDSTGKTVWRKKVTSFVTRYEGEISGSICIHEELERVVIFGGEMNMHSGGFILPDCFYNLNKLNYLSITNCDLDTLLPAIGNLKQLRYLELGSGAEKVVNIPAEISNLKLLDTLIVRGNIVLTDDLKALPRLNYLSTTGSYLPVLPNLKTLRCSFRGDSVPYNLTQYKKLQDLTINSLGHDENPYDPNTEITTYKAFNWFNYFDEISELSSLRSLVIENTVDSYNLVADTLGSFPDNFYQLKDLQKLSLQVPGVDSIKPDIKNLKNLHYLAIMSVRKVWPKELSELTNLDTLITFNDAGFPNNMSALPNLKYLQTSSNYLPLLPKLKYLIYACDSLPVSLLRSNILDSLTITLNYNNNDSIVLSNIENIIKRAAEMRSLQVIDIRVANMREALVQTLVALAPVVSKMPNLKSFRVRGDNLYEDQMTILTNAYHDQKFNFEYINSSW